MEINFKVIKELDFNIGELQKIEQSIIKINNETRNKRT